MIPDPGTTRLIHEKMIQDELERHGPAHMRRAREPFPIGAPLVALRAGTARALYALSQRISPERQQPIAPLPGASTSKGAAS